MYRGPSHRSWLRRGLLLVLPVLACFAGTVPHLTLRDLVAQSEAIVSGTVIRSWTGWDSEHRFIWTHTEVQVVRAWKGAPDRTVTISEPGGIADGLAMEIPGSTAYTPGEHVTVFLYRTPLTYLRTVGYGQGKFVQGRDGRMRSPLGEFSAAEFRARLVGEMSK